MSCSLAMLAACFSWSGFYVDTAIAMQDSGVERYGEYQREFSIQRPDRIESGSIHQYAYSRDAQNLYGCLELGYQSRLGPRLTTALAGRHCSSLATNKDRGVNAALLSFRWYPWGQR